MNDFASATMLRLIVLGLERQGIAAPALPPPRSAHVALADKRALVDRLLREHGPQVLLRIGEAVHHVRDEPASVALARSRDPLDLIERWQRLERFIHSRHRVLIEERGAGSLRLRHASLDAGQPPHPGEDLLVFGLLVALIDWLGTDGLRAGFAGDAGVRWHEGRWTARGMPADASRWAVQWRPALRRPPPPPPAGHDWIDAGHRLLAADPGRRWTLPLLAGELHTSPRTLQRRLGAGRSSFSALLTQARLAQSAKLLADTRQPPAEIGYLCGFSDQAHFTREFKRHAALTPARFREQFAASR